MSTERARLWQLISPTLPVGAYSYSQALEYAIHDGAAGDRASALSWIEGLLHNHLAYADLPVLARVHAAALTGDELGVARWSARLMAMRETAELRFEDASMGSALAQLMRNLGLAPPESSASAPVPFASAFAVACAQWSIAVELACAGYAWSWCEAQVAAAIKLVPLGHTDGQGLLLELGAQLDDVVAVALALTDDELGMSLPGLAIMSSLHETLYTRLFRS